MAFVAHWTFFWGNCTFVWDKQDLFLWGKLDLLFFVGLGKWNFLLAGEKWTFFFYVNSKMLAMFALLGGFGGPEKDRIFFFTEEIPSM